MERSDRDRELQSDLARLRAQQEHEQPPIDQLQRIMQRAVQRRQQHDASPFRVWTAHWLTGLWSPQFRLSLGGLALLSASVAVATVAVVIGNKSAPLEIAARPDQAASELAETDRRVPVRFMLPAAGASSVAVVGDFNAWQLDAVRLDDSDGDGVFAGTLLLPRGSYGYMFVIDGERWTTDPHATNFRDDGFGQRNAVIRVN